MLRAVKNGDVEMVESLLADGFTIREANIPGYTAIHLATINEDVQVLAAILRHATGRKKLLNIRTFRGDTALMLAVMKNVNITVIEMLLNAGVDVNVGNTERRTPLHEACKVPRLWLVELLLRHGADMDVQELTNDYTPLHYAAFSKDGAIVECLVQAGCDVHARSRCSATPLVYLCVAGMYESVALILSKYPTAANPSGCHISPLRSAVRGSSVECVDLLLAAGARVLREEEKGNETLCSALHNAVDSDSIFERLLRHTDPRVLKQSQPLLPHILCFGSDYNVQVFFNHDFGKENRNIKTLQSLDYCFELCVEDTYEYCTAAFGRILRYCFDFTPAKVLTSLLTFLSANNIQVTSKTDEIVYLIERGIGPEMLFWKPTLQGLIQDGALAEDYHLGLPTLAQLSAFAVRSNIRLYVGNDDWKAHCWVKDSKLPRPIKEIIFLNV